MDRNRFFCDLIDACYHRDIDYIKKVMNLDYCSMIKSNETGTEVYLCKLMYELYVVVTGTEKKWVDLKYNFYVKPYRIRDGQYVHIGYYYKFKSILNPMREFMYYNLIDVGNVWFIGHSSGGAVSRLLYDYFDSVLKNRVKDVKCWDIGVPAFSNSEFNNNIKGEFYLNKFDFIRFLPMWLFGYKKHKETKILKNKKFNLFKNHLPENYF